MKYNVMYITCNFLEDRFNILLRFNVMETIYNYSICSPTHPRHSEHAQKGPLTMKMAAKESGSAAAGIQSEEDLQRVIDQEAWYDSDDETSTRRLETDADADPDPSFEV